MMSAEIRLASTRISVRDFAPDDVPGDLIDAAVEAAGTAPSGANRQPWLFVVVRDAEVKRLIHQGQSTSLEDASAPQARWTMDVAVAMPSFGSLSADPTPSW